MWSEAYEVKAGDRRLLKRSKTKLASLNRDAHSLAKSSVYFEVGRQVWLLVPPAGIDNSVHPLV
jgi:hypothetical protein